jgi:N utilization substance protein B
MNRSQARENAFIMLFEAECRDDETALEIFEYAEELKEFEINDYVKKVFFGVFERRKEINELIDANSVGWNKKRISPVSRAILALSTFEMLAVDDVPAKVAINEAIEISKKYDDEKSYTFVNGVLNAIANA